MDTTDIQWLIRQAVVLPPLLLSLCVHEYAHARTALAFGDPTAYRLGRVTLNPLRHLDPIGTIMLVFSGIVGWAKPVPVNKFLLRPPGLGDICVSAAGPASNFVLALAAAGIYHLLPLDSAENSKSFELLTLALRAMVLANLGLGFFNLLPLFPLDGHHIARELLPASSQEGFMRWQLQFGSLLLFGMLLGPRLIETVTRAPFPINPLRSYMTHVIWPIFDLLGLQ